MRDPGQQTPIHIAAQHRRGTSRWTVSTLHSNGHDMKRARTTSDSTMFHAEWRTML
jgi:hypothetical protein